MSSDWSRRDLLRLDLATLKNLPHVGIDINLAQFLKRRQADQEVLHEIPKAPEHEMEVTSEVEIQEAVAAEEKM